MLRHRHVCHILLLDQVIHGLGSLGDYKLHAFEKNIVHDP